jgi:hypothetical protein
MLEGDFGRVKKVKKEIQWIPIVFKRLGPKKKKRAELNYTPKADPESERSEGKIGLSRIFFFRLVLHLIPSGLTV